MTVSRLRSEMSAIEFGSWKAYYRIEPWGWHDREIRTATILTKLHNTHVSNRSNLKQPKDFYTDRLQALEEAHKEGELQEKMRMKLLEANIEDRRRMIGQAWGTMAKDVKIGFSGDSSS